jgi:protein TonB
MFEDALMESSNKRRRKSKWSLLAFLVNFGALLALVIWPLFHPEALPTQMIATLMVAPSPPPAPTPAAPAPKVQPRSEMLTTQLQAPSRIPKAIKQLDEAAIPPSIVQGIDGPSNDIPGGMSTIIGAVGMGQPNVVKPRAATSLKLSSGVMAGHLLTNTFPQYPSIARAARVQGVIVLQATISKDGSIENLRVISGPPMLQQAALDAVRSWRYKPYLLNGEPVEVETTINVVFNLGE